MKLEYRKLSIALILLYAVFMIISAYEFFDLHRELVYNSHAASLINTDNAGSVFTRVSLIVALTLITGLAGLLISLSKKNAEVIYVEKKQTTKKTSGDQSQDHEDQKIDMKAIQKLLTNTPDELKASEKILVYLCKHLGAGMGVFYKAKEEAGKRALKMEASYAISIGESKTIAFEFGEGLVGQVAVQKKSMVIDDIPEGYIKITSGLGSALPKYLLIAPIVNDHGLFGVVEIASFNPLGNREMTIVTEAYQPLIKSNYKNTGLAEKSAAADNDEPAGSKNSDKKLKK